MARRPGRSRFAQETIGSLLAAYVRFVQRTNAITTIPPDINAAIAGQTPLIVAMWHGQHLMLPLAWPDGIDRMAALISRHEDAGAQAVAMERLGVTPVRGSGGPADRAYYKGGAPAMRELLRQLESGVSVALTADVPKVARVSGLGIVTLAKLSGRPIVPTAVVTSRKSSSTHGIAPRSGCHSDAPPSSSAISFASPRTPMMRRWRPRGSRSSEGSTRRMSALTQCLERATPARI